MTTKDINSLFALCKARLYEEYLSDNAFNNIDFDIDTLRPVIVENTLSAFLYKPIKTYNDLKHTIDSDVISSIGNKIHILMFRELNKLHALKIITQEAEKRGITFILFKGIVIADLYPQHAERCSSDSDILVSDDERISAEQLLIDCGYSKDKENSKDTVQVYFNLKLNHTVELHTRLWEDYEGPRIEVLKKLDLSNPGTNIRIKACGIEVNTLGYEQHLVYQFFHIIKHFSLNGVGIRYLIDITLYVNKYFDEIDFDKFWEHIEMLGYTKFVEAFFEICTSELRMTDKVFDNHEAIFDCGIDDLVIDLLNVGNINDKKAGWQIMGAMEAYFTGEVVAPKSKIKRELSMIFPSAKALPKKYSYARKFPVLLPFAWIHRDILFLVKKASKKDDFYGVSEKVSVGERRLHLISELGLTGEVQID